MTEKLPQLEQDNQAIHIDGRARELTKPSIEENAPWGNNNVGAFELGNGVDVASDTDVGILDITPQTLGESNVYIVIPKSEDDKTIYRVGTLDGLVTISELTMGDDGKWGVSEGKALSEQVKIGRSNDSDFKSSSPLVSRVHARVGLSEEGRLRIESGATNNTEIVIEKVDTENQQYSDLGLEGNDITIPRPNEEIPHIDLAEARAAVERVLGANDEKKPETKESSPAPSNPEDEFNATFAEAIKSPDALLKALMAPAETDGGVELKRELQKLLDTYKEVRTAQKSESIWETVVAPELKKISQEDTEAMVRSLRQTHDFLMSARQGCDLLRRAVFDGYQDAIQDVQNRMPVRVSEIMDRLASGTYFMGRAQYEEAAHRVGTVDIKALSEHEEVKKLSTKNQEPTIEEVEELHSLLLQSGGRPEALSAVQSRLYGEMPESNTWRRKLDTVQQIAQYARRIKLDALNDNVTGRVRVACDSLEFFQDSARKGRYDGEAINTATMQLKGIAEEFEGAQRLAQLIQNLAEYA